MQLLRAASEHLQNEIRPSELAQFDKGAELQNSLRILYGELGIGQCRLEQHLPAASRAAGASDGLTGIRTAIGNSLPRSCAVSRDGSSRWPVKWGCDTAPDCIATRKAAPVSLSSMIALDLVPRADARIPDGIPSAARRSTPRL